MAESDDEGSTPVMDTALDPRRASTFDEDESRTNVYATEVDPTPRIADADAGEAIPARYDRGAMLGAGGMGTVWACHDVELERDIALKTLSFDPKAQPHLLARFVREARIQARLDHPAIVPLHELRAEREIPYFTMKRVQGLTLAHILGRIHSGDGEFRKRYGARRLLTAFGRVAEAIDYAHTQGVIHRDLKPSNIMIGDFGAVYVIDWGIAKVVGETMGGQSGAFGALGSPAPGSPGTDRPAQSPAKGAPAAPDLTRAGARLGTGGYIAPELESGRLRHADELTDLYALGVILFEILATARFQPLFLEHGSVERALARAVPDCAPELVRMCVRATARDRGLRHPSVRALVEEMNGFLEGDRDTERRRVLAEEHAARAATALRTSDPSEELRMQDAWRDVGRALALDPNNALALRTLVALLGHVPERVPAAVEAEIDQKARASVKNAGRLAALLYVVVALCIPVVASMGILDGPIVLATFGFALLAAFFTFRVSPQRFESVSPLFYPGFVSSTVLMGLIGSIFGPLLVVPALLAVNTMGHVYTWYRGRTYQAFLIAALAIVVPWLLQSYGLVPDSLVLGASGLEVRSWAIDLVHAASEPLLLVFSVATLLGGVVAASLVRANLDRMIRRDHLRAWQLQQLLPPGVLAEPALGPPALG